VAHSVLLALAVAAAVAAAVLIVGYPFARSGSWLDPYGNRGARWIVYLGAGISLALFVVLARSSS